MTLRVDRDKGTVVPILSGSTFSITNFGIFGVTTGTPIINQPNVGIYIKDAKKPGNYIKGRFYWN